MSNLNLKDSLEIALTRTKQYIDQEDEGKTDKIDEVELYAILNEIFSESDYSSIYYFDEDNNLVLNNDLPAGTYTLKYEFEDGTESLITDFTVEESTNEPIEIDVMNESEIYLNQRWSNSNIALTAQTGRVAFIFPINAVDTDTVCTMTVENAPVNLNTYKDYLSMVFLNDSRTATLIRPEGASPGYFESFVASGSNGSYSCTFSITVVPDYKYGVLCLPLKATATEATESDLSGLIITLKEGGNN